MADHDQDGQGRQNGHQRHHCPSKTVRLLGGERCESSSLLLAFGRHGTWPVDAEVHDIVGEVGKPVWKTVFLQSGEVVIGGKCCCVMFGHGDDNDDD